MCGESTARRLDTLRETLHAGNRPDTFYDYRHRMLNIMFTRSVVHRLTFIAAFAITVLTAAPAWAQSSQPWWERIRFGGDFRERLEGFFQDGATTRQRVRFRLRLTMNSEINDDVAFGLRLGSGDSGNPISTNQSFSDVLTNKPINIDRAYMTYNPSGAKALTLGGGKFSIPVTRTEMTFDNDLNWEGIYQQVRGSTGPVSYRFVAAQVPLEESSGNDDAILFAAYGEIGVSFGDHRLQVSVADYGFRDVDRVAIALNAKDIGRNTNPFSLNEDGQVTGFESDFNLVDVVARATLHTGRPGYPVQLTTNVVKNTDAATDEDFGVWLTAAYGQAAQPRSYRLAYTFARIEQDAVLSAFTFSDSPGTNIWMHRTTLSYRVAARIHIDFIGIFTKKLLEAPGELNTLLKRTQLDTRISF